MARKRHPALIGLALGVMTLGLLSLFVLFVAPQFGCPFFLLVIVAGLCALWYVQWRLDRRRRVAMESVARALGLAYRQSDDAIAQDHKFLNVLRRGRRQYAYNVLEGRSEGHRVLVFDYHPTGHGSFDTSFGEGAYDFTVLVLELEREFPELRIVPRGLVSKAAAAAGLPQVSVESVEFSDRFAVQAQDTRFAYDVCHPRMMDLLLALGDLGVEIEGTCLALWSPRRLDAEEVPERLRQLVEIRDLMPEYLFRD